MGREVVIVYSELLGREGEAAVSYFTVLFPYLCGMTEYKHEKQIRCGDSRYGTSEYESHY